MSAVTTANYLMNKSNTSMELREGESKIGPDGEPIIAGGASPENPSGTAATTGGTEPTNPDEDVQEPVTRKNGSKERAANYRKEQVGLLRYEERKREQREREVAEARQREREEEERLEKESELRRERLQKDFKMPQKERRRLDQEEKAYQRGKIERHMSKMSVKFEREEWSYKPPEDVQAKTDFGRGVRGKTSGSLAASTANSHSGFGVSLGADGDNKTKTRGVKAGEDGKTPQDTKLKKLKTTGKLPKSFSEHSSPRGVRFQVEDYSAVRKRKHDLAKTNPSKSRA
ncbi:unnamed protein product [Amoebophrya sp. A25]|nr:unnamed protein product [Amoebophrya sp. A25]|eukprot:GSA25T00015482001.1